MSKPLPLSVTNADTEHQLAWREWEELRDAGQLLDATAMATFTARGVLSFPGIVPDELNRAALTAIASGAVHGGGYRGEPLSEFLATGHPLAGIFALPQVRGIIASLVGPRPRHDHHALHVVGPHHRGAQSWHADATIDPRSTAFDIQVMYFPHDTPMEMGGTMLLPGSHLRQIHEVEISRYQHIVGEMPTVCPAGTIHVLHHGIWHRGRGNATDRQRSMFKLRLNPEWKQERLFNTAGHHSAAVAQILGTSEPWFGSDLRLEYVNRIAFWRALTGDATYDHSLWLGRLEASPTKVL